MDVWSFLNAVGPLFSQKGAHPRGSSTEHTETLSTKFSAQRSAGQNGFTHTVHVIVH